MCRMTTAPLLLGGQKTVLTMERKTMGHTRKRDARKADNGNTQIENTSRRFNLMFCAHPVTLMMSSLGC
jgi:hypothetical protein